MEGSTVSVLLQIPVVTLSATSLSFGNQKVGTTSQAKMVTLTNTGRAPLSLRSIAIKGKNSGDFAETNTCGSSMAGGASCSFSVTFTPTALGTRSAVLTISDNAVGGPQGVTVKVTGT